jgi:uncharacterized delta-60 repeat protein
MRAVLRASLAVVVSATPACKVDPLYCDESHECTDPARPFCDLNGDYPASEDVPRTCIADPGADGGPDVEGSFSLAVASERLFVRQGESAAIDVTVAREDDFDEAVTVELRGLPDGVVAEPVTIEPGEAAGSLTISADADSTQGAANVDVVGTAGAVVGMAGLRLLVAGEPGTLDRSFADSGKFTLRFGDGDTFGGGLLMQDDGGVIVVGAVFGQAPSLQGFALRLDGGGAIDDSFGLHGVASPEVKRAPLHDTVMSTRDGRLVVGGVVVQDDASRLSLFAYTPDGDVDPGFGNSGTAPMDPTMPGGTTGVVRIFELDDGALLSVASAADETGFSALHVARHDADGTLDENYRINTPSQEPATAILDRDGRLVVAGQIVLGTTPVPSFIARYLPDGSPDISFGTDGVVQVSNLSTSFQEVAGLVELEGGRLLAIGFAYTAAGTVLTIARYNASGVPDLTFGDGGTIVTSVEFETWARVALVDTEGRVIVAGRSSADVPALVRILPDGSLDSSFGDSGMATVDFGIAGGGATQANGLGVDADGRFVISGALGDAETSLGVARIWP